MTTYCVFDTETSGMFDFRLPADDPSQPRLAQFSGIITDKDMDVLDTFSHLVKPDDWEMSPGAEAVNGLSTEFLMEHGRPIGEVLDIFEELVNSGHHFAAYNAQFDLKVMRGEMRRAGRDDLFTKTPNVCLMRACASLKVPKASGKGGWPALSDACNHFDIEQKGAHDAIDDAAVAYEIMKKLAEIDALPEATIHFAKNRDK